MITRLVPSGPPVDATAFAAELRALADRAPLQPFDDRILDWLAALSRRLLAPAVARRRPELAALGYFVRPTELSRLQRAFAEATPAGAIRVPRGLVLHVPPANVDVMFAYSWVLSAVVGNVNVVRVSGRLDAAGRELLDLVAAAAGDAADAEVVATQQLVTWGHDDPATAAFSSVSDLRVVWGGDAAVDAVRAHRQAPHALDLTFPDRVSLAVIDAAAWTAMGDDARKRTASGLVNDIWWFDQRACASPLAIVWRGDEPIVDRARSSLYGLLATEVAARAIRTEPATSVDKQVAAAGAAIHTDVTVLRPSDEVVAVCAGHVRDLPLSLRARLAVEGASGGVVLDVRVDHLDELAPVLGRRHQTLVHVGLTADELVAFARTLNGRGVDRIVPPGKALTFGRLWDGNDLLVSMTRAVVVDPGVG